VSRMAINVRKDGGPNTKFYDSSDTISQFDAVKSWLLKNCKKHVATDPPTGKYLSQLTVQLLQFVEDVCGNKASSPPCIRIPNKFFLDFKPGGGLCIIMNAVYKYKSEHSWRRFDFQSPSRREANIDLLKEIIAALEAASLYTAPKIFVHSSVDDDLKKSLSEVISKHGATIIENESGATHIVYDEVEFQEEYARAVMRRDKLTLFHFYSFPDSHDTWAANVDLDFDLPTSLPEETTPFKVSANWLIDLDTYNEWMNEGDYLVDDNGGKIKAAHCLSIDDMMSLNDPDRKNKKEKSSGKGKRPRSPPSPRGSRRKTGRNTGTPVPSGSVPSPAKPSKKSTDGRG